MPGSPTSLPGADPPAAEARPGDAIASLRQRLARAESERDTWRRSGDQERYLAAYGLVDALERQLEALLRGPQA